MQQLHAGAERGPVDAADGDVLAGRARLDRVALGLQRLDHLGRPDAQRLQRAAVVAPVGLPVADQPPVADLGHLHRRFGTPPSLVLSCATTPSWVGAPAPSRWMPRPASSRWWVRSWTAWRRIQPASTRGRRRCSVRGHAGGSSAPTLARGGRAARGWPRAGRSTPPAPPAVRPGLRWRAGVVHREAVERGLRVQEPPHRLGHVGAVGGVLGRPTTRRRRVGRRSTSSASAVDELVATWAARPAACRACRTGRTARRRTGTLARLRVSPTR